MTIQELLDKYWDQIDVEESDYIAFDNAKHDAAYLLLSLPLPLLREYQVLKSDSKELPDAAEFWKETGLGERLGHSERVYKRGHEPLKDILSFLQGKIRVTYETSGGPDRIFLDVTEIPEFYEEEPV